MVLKEGPAGTASSIRSWADFVFAFGYDQNRSWVQYLGVTAISEAPAAELTRLADGGSRLFSTSMFGGPACYSALWLAGDAFRDLCFALNVMPAVVKSLCERASPELAATLSEKMGWAFKPFRRPWRLLLARISLIPRTSDNIKGFLPAALTAALVSAEPLVRHQVLSFLQNQLQRRGYQLNGAVGYSRQDLLSAGCLVCALWLNLSAGDDGEGDKDGDGVGDCEDLAPADPHTAVDDETQQGDSRILTTPSSSPSRRVLPATPRSPNITATITARVTPNPKSPSPSASASSLSPFPFPAHHAALAFASPQSDSWSPLVASLKSSAALALWLRGATSKWIAVSPEAAHDSALLTHSVVKGTVTVLGWGSMTEFRQLVTVIEFAPYVSAVAGVACYLLGW